jgi:hypothetical protein
MYDAQSAPCARLNAIRRTCWHELGVPEDFRAPGSARRERVGDPCNERMGEAFFGHAASDVGNMVSELPCEFIHALNHGIGIDVQSLRSTCASDIAGNCADIRRRASWKA